MNLIRMIEGSKVFSKTYRMGSLLIHQNCELEYTNTNALGH